MLSRPDVSLVVIAFNEEDTVADCIRALLAQVGGHSIEVLAVDDGSTDRTADVVRSFTELDPRVRLLAHDQNRGRGAARRTGQDAALAPLVGYVDADVVVPPDWLQRCIVALQHHSAVSGIATPDGDCVYLARVIKPTARLRRHTSPISGGNVLFEAEALRQVGFAENFRLGEDFRLARRMAAKGFSVVTVADLVAEHREAKSYRASILWLWQNGLDAARLPFEFRTVRIPDIVWAGWLAALLALLALGSVGTIPWLEVLAGAALVTIVVAIGHTASRFRPWPRAGRWVVAATLDVPIIAAYLAGRTVGLPAALWLVRHRSV